MYTCVCVCFKKGYPGPVYLSNSEWKTEFLYFFIAGVLRSPLNTVMCILILQERDSFHQTESIFPGLSFGISVLLVYLGRHDLPANYLQLRLSQRDFGFYQKAYDYHMADYFWECTTCASPCISTKYLAPASWQKTGANCCQWGDGSEPTHSDL